MNKKNRNKGFSLIEVIVVIALMAIVTGATMSIYSWIRTQRIEKLTENISDSINDLRTANRTKDGTYSLYIVKASDGFEASMDVNDVVCKKTNLGSIGKIEVIDTSGNKKSIEGSTKLHLRFDKSTGKLVLMNIGGSGIDVNTEIYISYKDLSRKISISSLTGKHYIE